MKTKEKISIDQFDNKKFQLISHQSLSVNSQKAIVTHYLHNINNASEKHFKKEADKVLRSFIKYNSEDLGKTVVAEEAIRHLLFEIENVPFPPPLNYRFKFIDLFAGIGGFRLAFQNLGGKCVFTSEWDREAQKTYRVNFGEVPFGDITKEETKKFIPNDFDILCAGFPCQAFSIAGKRGGFDDTRGTLFFDVAEIIRRKKPKAVFLENVKGLRNHDKGKTLDTILNVLRNDLNYYVPEPQIINAKDFGVPQNRERIFIVGFRKDLGIDNFVYPLPSNKKVKFSDVKENKVVPTKYYLKENGVRFTPY